MIKKESGITLTALVITIIVLIIISSIAVYEGKEALINAKIQTYETNMLTIKAKAKTYGEELEAALWAYSDDDKDDKKSTLLEEYGLTEVDSISSSIINQLSSDVTESDYEVYSIEGLLENNGLTDIQDSSDDGEYLVVYNADDYTKLDVVYTDGVSYNGTVYYTLSTLQEAYTGD